MFLNFLKLAVFQMYVIDFMGENASLYETILVYEETIYKYFPSKIISRNRGALLNVSIL